MIIHVAGGTEIAQLTGAGEKGASSAGIAPVAADPPAPISPSGPSGKESKPKSAKAPATKANTGHGSVASLQWSFYPKDQRPEP